MLFRIIVVAGVVLAATPTTVLRDQANLERREETSFCVRNPHTCGAAGEVWDGLKEKGRLLAAIVLSRGNLATGEAAPATERFNFNGRTEPSATYGANSLSKVDQQPSWLGPAEATNRAVPN